MVRPNPYVAYGAVATGSASALATANQRFAQKFLAESEARMQREAATTGVPDETAPVTIKDNALTTRWRGLPTWAQYTIGAVGVGTLLFALNALRRRF